MEPTPIRCRERCYSCKVPWKPNHRCRGKGKVHIVEVHYDNEDEEMHVNATIDAYLEQSDKGSESCASEGQLEGQDDIAYPSSSPSGNVEDSTLQHSGDTCEDSYVLALKHDELRRLDDLPVGVDMASRKSCMENDELPMMSEPHFSSSQSPMLATTHEDISGIPDMVEEPCVGIVHKEHMDLQTQEERYGLEIVDLTHTYQYEESESPLLEIPLMDQVVESDSLLGHSLPGSIYSDEDALLIGRNDHSTCLDTSVWDPGADDISRVSAQEDTTAHTGYGAIQIGAAVGDGVQWHAGGLSSTGDSGQFSALYFEECVVGDSIVDTSSERHEVAPQQDCDQESRHLAGQLRVSEGMIMAATRCIDDTHALVAGYCWRASMAQDSLDGGLVIDDFHTLRERVIVMRVDYQQLLMDRDYLLEVGEMYHRALREQEVEVDRLTHELVRTRRFLEGTQKTLQESESRSEELLEETRQKSTTPISAESQIYPSATLREDVGGLAVEHQLREEHEEYPGSLMSMERYDPEIHEDIHRSQGPPFTRGGETVGHTRTHGDSRARGSFEDTSIYVPGLVDLHVEDDPVVHPGSMMLQVYTGDHMSMQGHTMMSGSSQRHTEVYSGIQGDALDGREEMYSVEHGDSSPLQQYTDLGDHLHRRSSCVSDYGWRMIDPQLVEIPTVVPDGWCSVMSTGDYLPWVSMDELLVKTFGLTKAYATFQSYSWLQIFMMAFPDTFIIDSSTGGARQWQGAWRVGRPRPPNRSVLIAYIKIGVDHQGQTVEALGMMESILGHGTEDISEVATYSDSHWDEGGVISTVTGRAHQQLVGIGSDELPNLTWDPGVHLVNSLFHLMRIQEWRIQNGYFDQTVMIRVEQHQHDGPCQRLAWDPGITGLGISLTGGDEWTFAGGSPLDFPLSFSIGESTSLVGDSLRSCSTSLWQQHVQSVGAVLGLVWSGRTDSFRFETVCYLQETHGSDMLQDYISRGIAVHILIWDPGIGMLGSSTFDGVEFRVEWLLGELTEILWPLIILLIRSMWVSCVVSTWRDHILRGVYLVSHRWIWDPGIICSWIQLLLEDKQSSGREDCNVPILGHYNITTFQSVMPTRVAR
jgi:hypothetical protein